jgi:NAD(P)H-dependent FMN reductase
LKLDVIVGSTREGRAADRVLPWLLDRIGERGEFDVEVLDLREWPLPMFGETMATVGDLADPTYSQPIVRMWNDAIRAADAYIVLTPEYNHSIPGVLKNALDCVFASFGFRNKPMAFVAYSVAPVGGARAVEQLALVAIEAEAVPLRNSVLIGAVGAAFDESGLPADSRVDATLTILLDDLRWWASALAEARARGELRPAFFRRRSG